MNYIDWCREFFDKHPATSIGLVGGAVLGLGIATFGFWRTFVVAVCVGAGLYIGRRVDLGESFDFSPLKERWQNLRRK